MKKILITTAIDYTNDVVHIGHAYQKIVADVLARYYRLTLGGKNTFFLTGTDEHGGNIEIAAKTKGKTPQKFIDKIVQQDKKEWDTLQISPDRFIRTTDADHKKTVKKFWRKSALAGDIYKGIFTGKYCFGCESYKTESEIVEGKCPLHPTKEPQKVEEENYFFRWKKYQRFLEEELGKTPEFIYPSTRQHEMQSFLTFPGLADIPISRPKEKISWGIPVPDDPTQVIYVWFDALINYYTATKPVGFWGEDTHIIHILGKDNLRWHALLWPAMLTSAGVEKLPDTIYAHGFINLNGQKISKSLGNVIRPSELVKQFGSDAVRYCFLKYGPAVDDVDITIERIKAVYNSELADGLGNTISRLAKVCGTSGFSFYSHERLTMNLSIKLAIGLIYLHKALEVIWKRVDEIDQAFDERKPWNLKGEELRAFLTVQVKRILQIATDLQPFMPETSAKILHQFSQKKINAKKPYFPRMS